MKTTININGLDVEFSDQKPTSPGAYWYSVHEEMTPMLIHVMKSNGGELYAPGEGLIAQFSGIGLWSAPLVPVTEVEKSYREGHKHGTEQIDLSAGTKRVFANEDYRQSNSRRIVEGQPL